jgi:hypothetical protein
MQLLVGCGHSREKRLGVQGREQWSGLVTLDLNPAAKPDVVWDLNDLPLPFPDNCFSEVHAYECLEHTGRQGDAAFFFQQFYEFWRILHAGGLLFITVPSPKSVWAWGDPSHTRVIPVESAVFLSQAEYTRQLGVTPMSDFRALWKGDFETLCAEDDGVQGKLILRAKK